MSVYKESGFTFDFGAASAIAVHDKADPHDGNTFWPGVDFRVADGGREVWIEVKSWSYRRILDRVERRGAMKDYEAKLAQKTTEEFRDEIVAKFLGTSCYLGWSGLGIQPRVLYVVFLEPPDRGSRALLGPFRDRLRDEFKNAQARPWGKRIGHCVVDLQGFQQKLPGYTVTPA